MSKEDKQNRGREQSGTHKNRTPIPDKSAENVRRARKFPRRAVVTGIGAIGAAAVVDVILSGVPNVPDIFQKTTGRPESAEIPNGIWTHEEVVNLADSMAAESRYPEISHAGEILRRNANGLPSLSQQYSLMEDSRITFNTLDSISVSGQNVPIYATSVLEPSGAQENGILVAEGGGVDESFQAQPRWVFSEIDFNGKALKKLSPFGLEFYAAKEMQQVFAVGMLTEYKTAIYSQAYRFPTDPNQRDAAKNYLFKNAPVTAPNGAPISTAIAVDVISSSVLVPDYAQAVKDGRFSKEDLASLPFFANLSQFYTDKGLLVEENGIVKWNANEATLAAAWLYIAADVTAQNSRK